MRRFRFPLEVLRRLREREEDSRRRDFGQVVQVQASHAQLIEWLEVERGRVSQGALEARQTGRDQASGETSPTLDVRDLAAWERYRIAVERRTEQELGVSRKIAGVVGERRQALVEARRRREVIELLRRRKLKAWRQALERAETLELDEIALQTWRRDVAAEREEHKDGSPPRRSRAWTSDE